MEPTSPQSSPAIPIAIIFGFAMIALAIFFTNRTSNAPVIAINPETGQEQVIPEGTPRPVSEKDYILGNPNAPILLVEYSDYECPFCQQYHQTLNQIMDEYGVTGKVAWAYRQFPLTELHPNAAKISEAALCVGDIGGSDAFWKFTNLIFEGRQPGEFTNVTKIPSFAEQSGVTIDDYAKCLNEGRMKTELAEQMSDGVKAGAYSTPYTVLIVGNQQVVISGAQPYDTVKGIVQNLIDQLEGEFDPATVEDVPELPTNEIGVPILQ